MALSTLTKKVDHERPRLALGHSFADPAYLADLQANSHRAEVQQIIRQGIKTGAIRVRPDQKGDILIFRG